MRGAIVITTIYVPTVLSQWRAIAPDIDMIVVGDLKTPPEVADYCASINARYISPDEQRTLGYRCSEVISWCNPQRRNIGFLEALKLPIDYLVSLDTDNAPIDRNHLTHVERMLTQTERRPVFQGAQRWFNAGAFANPYPYYLRGFPYGQRGPQKRMAGAYVETEPRIGVVESLVVGDPDISATERLESTPHVTAHHLALDRGIAIHPVDTWGPINTQATAFVRELVPLFGCWPRVGRMDDIWAGYFAQAVMSATDYHVLYGPPYVRQARHEHDIVRDLQDELHGIRHTDALCATLRAIAADLPRDATVLANAWTVANALLWESQRFGIPHDFLTTWLEDCGTVLA